MSIDPYTLATRWEEWRWETSPSTIEGITRSSELEPRVEKLLRLSGETFLFLASIKAHKQKSPEERWKIYLPPDPANEGMGLDEIFSLSSTGFFNSIRRFLGLTPVVTAETYDPPAMEHIICLPKPSILFRGSNIITSNRRIPRRFAESAVELREHEQIDDEDLQDFILAFQEFRNMEPDRVPSRVTQPRSIADRISALFPVPPVRSQPKPKKKRKPRKPRKKTEPQDPSIWDII